MPIVTFIWLVGPLVVLCLVIAYAMRRAAQRREEFESARFRGRTSETGLASAMSEALTRMRGQELAQQARFEALEGFLRQVIESLPHGVFVLGRDGNLRVANAQALRSGSGCAPRPKGRSCGRSMGPSHCGAWRRNACRQRRVATRRSSVPERPALQCR